MGLRDIVIPEDIVATPGGEFTVRGLNTDDLGHLIRKHGSAMEKAYNDFMDANVELSTDDVLKFLIPLLGSAPELMSELIACAADDLDAAPIARRMPFPCQVDALEKIARLTFEMAGGPKKFVETVIRLIRGTTGLLQSLGT